jgi:acetate---CoA ligase (ADP-forming)
VSKGVAIVGASDSSIWTGQLVHNLTTTGYEGAIWLVNPNRSVVCGMPTVPSLGDVGGDLDAVVVAVAPAKCPEVVSRAVELGARDIVVVSDGFSERGPDGAGGEAQEALVAACGPETRLYGPNGVGFADFRRNICAIAEPVPEKVGLGDISVISQSGGILSTTMAALLEDGAGLDWCVSLGNAAQFDLADAVDYICDRGTSQVICMYVETLADPTQRLRRAFARAAGLGIELVMLKAGWTNQSARIAMTHTASVAGNNAEVDAFLAALSVLRVETLEELTRVAVLARMKRRVKTMGAVAIVGSSGGQAAIASDLAHRDGLRLAVLTHETRSFLRESAGPGSFLENPFDFVGRVAAKASSVDLYSSILADPNVCFALAPYSIIWPDYHSAGGENHRASLETVAESAHRTGTPTVVVSLGQVPWTAWMKDFRSRHLDVAVVRGLAVTIKALSILFPAAEDEIRPDEQDIQHDLEHVLGEMRGRELLQGLGLPVVDGRVCHNTDEVPGAVEALHSPLAVKFDIAGVLHKADVGGVTLNCLGLTDVTEAIARSFERLSNHGIAKERVLGILIEEQASGRELLVGLTRSEIGCFMTIGEGGTKAGRGTSARTVLLPVGELELQNTCNEFLADLAGRKGGAAMLDALQVLAHEFVSGGLADYKSVEINPFIVNERTAQIADVLLEAKVASTTS